MAIIELEFKAQLSRQSPLSSLQNVRLGIDAGHYLSTLLARSPCRDSLVTAIGGIPTPLKACLDHDLENFALSGIQPIFIFSGIDPQRSIDHDPNTVFSKSAAVSDRRSQAWQLYNANRREQALQIFAETLVQMPPEMDHFMMRELKGKGVEFLVAPFSSLAQLTYLSSDGRRSIDAIHSPPEVLLFGAKRVITQFDWSRRTFTWLDKDEIRASMDHVTDDQFLDICLLAGVQGCPIFPPLEAGGPYGPGFTLRAAQDLVRTYGSGINAVMNYSEVGLVKDMDYVTKYCRARSTVIYHVVLQIDGGLAPLMQKDVPNNLHELVGQRLPEEVYYYLSRGLIGTHVLQILLSGMLLETQPLDNGASQEYKSFIDDLLYLQTTCLSLLSQPFARFYHYKQVVGICWFRTTTEQQMVHRVDITPYQEVNQWNVKTSNLPSSLDLQSCLGKLRESAATTIVPKDPAHLLTTTEEILANTLWRTLQLRSFIHKEKHTLTSWGIALSSSLDYLKQLGEMDMQSNLWLAFELLRTRSLRPEDYSERYAGSPAIDGDNRNHAQLICRAVSLIPVRDKSSSHNSSYSTSAALWPTAYLSHSLLAFRAFASTLRRTLRDLLEMTILSLLLNADARRIDRDNWTEIALKLPLGEDCNVGMGILMKTFLEKKNSNDKDVAKDLDTEFPNIVSPSDDLKRALKFWDAVSENLFK